jgi:hypothetical protein
MYIDHCKTVDTHDFQQLKHRGFLAYSHVITGLYLFMTCHILETFTCFRGRSLQTNPPHFALATPSTDPTKTTCQLEIIPIVTRNGRALQEKTTVIEM